MRSNKNHSISYFITQACTQIFLIDCRPLRNGVTSVYAVGLYLCCALLRVKSIMLQYRSVGLHGEQADATSHAVIAAAAASNQYCSCCYSTAR